MIVLGGTDACECCCVKDMVGGAGDACTCGHVHEGSIGAGAIVGGIYVAEANGASTGVGG